MNVNKASLFWGILLIGGGGMALAQQFGYLDQLPESAWMWVFALVSLAAFLSYALSGWREWGWLFPAGVFGGLAVTIGLATNNVDNAAVGSPLFFGLLIPFAAAYLTDRAKNWWALIPGGVMFFLAMTTLLVDNVGGEWVGALFLFLIGLSFFIVYWNNRTRTWALLVAYILGVLSLAPAMATGCTVVVKPAGTTPLTDIRCCELIDKAIQDGGGPKGVINVVTGPGSVIGEELLVNPTVRKIGFTGATDTGRRVMQSAAKDFKHVTLELGGSDPMIVCDDADLDRAVSAASVGRFFNCGQACLAVKRLYLFDNIADQFMEKLVEKAKKISVGNGLKPDTLMGPLHTKEQRQEVEEQVEDAVKRGAKILYGGQRPKGEEYDKGFYLQPTLVADVDPASRLLREECFGPALPIVRVKNLDQAIEQANNSIFGLGSSIWTRDINRAMAGAERIEAGYTWVNSAQIIYDELPFGGVKQSGLGKEHGEEAIEHYTDSKSVVIATETQSEMVGGE